MILPHDNQGLRVYIDSLSKHRILSRAEEKELLRRTQAGDPRAERELVRCNLRFVVTVASSFQHRGLALDELITEGSTGLREAALRFKPETNYRFISYAVWWIRAKITKAIDLQSRLIRIGSNQEVQVRKYRALPVEQCIGGSLAPIPKALAKLPKRTQAAAEASAPFSLDCPVSEEGARYDAFLASPEPSPEDWTASRTEAEWITRLLHTLSPKERRVLSLFYGLDSREPMVLGDVGELVGLSGERVRQVKDGALKKLRSRVTNKGGG